MIMNKYWITLLFTVTSYMYPNVSYGELVMGPSSTDKPFASIKDYKAPSDSTLELLELLDSISWTYYKDRQEFFYTRDKNNWGGLNHSGIPGYNRRIFIANAHRADILENLDFNNIDWDDYDTIFALHVAGHEYGHSIIDQAGNDLDNQENEILANACGTYFLIQLGCTPERIKSFYKETADFYKDDTTSKTIDHPDLYGEFITSMNNVDKIEAVLSAKIPKDGSKNPNA